jgi:hypothetical protein
MNIFEDFNDGKLIREHLRKHQHLNKTYQELESLQLACFDTKFDPIDYIIVGALYAKGRMKTEQDRTKWMKRIGLVNGLRSAEVAKNHHRMFIYADACGNPSSDLDVILENFQLTPRDETLIREEDKEAETQMILEHIQAEEEINKMKAVREKEKIEAERTKCDICLEQLYGEDFWPLTVCGHTFHIKCLGMHFHSKIQERQFPLKCPAVRCGQDAQQVDIHEVLDTEDIRKYEDFYFKKFVEERSNEYSWCPTAGCEYVFIYDHHNPMGANFLCPLCLQNYCLDCRVQYHTGKSCGEYKADKINSTFSKDDEQFLSFVKGAKFKQCGKCKFWVERNQGCNHMTCRCGYQFCYQCGGQYGQCGH